MELPRLNLRLLLFAALSAADLALTWWLLEASGRVAYEANPIADWFLDSFGWVGLALFKASCVVLVIALTLIVARHRPRVAFGVQTFACSVLVLVLAYSALVAGSSSPVETPEEINRALAEYNRQCREAMQGKLAMEYNAEFEVATLESN